MNRMSFSQVVIAIAGLIIFVIPQNIFAAELTFRIVPNNIPDDNATLVEVRIDPQSKGLNVVEGTISFQGTILNELSVQVENGQSVLPLWPVPPLYLPSEKVVRFTGGVPNGFDKEGLLFRLRLSSPVSGNLVISYIDGSAYLNDGDGTKEDVSSEPITISFDSFGDSKVVETFYETGKLKSVTIILLIAVVFFLVLLYGHKKIIKK